jgi:excisionase family DNA binding protein
MEEKLYTINELSKLLHVTRATLYSWIKAGKLPALKAGYKWLIRESFGALFGDKKERMRNFTQNLRSNR